MDRVEKLVKEINKVYTENQPDKIIFNLDVAFSGLNNEEIDVETLNKLKQVVRRASLYLHKEFGDESGFYAGIMYAILQNGIIDIIENSEEQYIKKVLARKNVKDVLLYIKKSEYVMNKDIIKQVKISKSQLKRVISLLDKTGLIIIDRIGTYNYYHVSSMGKKYANKISINCKESDIKLKKIINNR